MANVFYLEDIFKGEKTQDIRDWTITSAVNRHYPATMLAAFQQLYVIAQNRAIVVNRGSAQKFSSAEELIKNSELGCSSRGIIFFGREEESTFLEYTKGKALWGTSEKAHNGRVYKIYTPPLPGYEGHSQSVVDGQVISIPYSTPLSPPARPTQK